MTTTKTLIDLLYLLDSAPEKIFHDNARDQLVQYVDILYKEIVQELRLNCMTSSSLSNVHVPLDELYTGGGTCDGETIYGQIDLLNVELMKALRKSLKWLTQVVNENPKQLKHKPIVRLVDLSAIHEEDQSETKSDKEKNSEEEHEDESSSNVASSEGDSEDEVQRRIQQRMERSMQGFDISEDKDVKYEDDDEQSSNVDEVDMVDPAAEELNDGFFDIAEMEGFADEEEDIHMPALYGEQVEEEGDSDSDSDDSEEGDGGHIDSNAEPESDILFSGRSTSANKSKSKRKYRSEEDINALTNMYGDVTEDDKEDAANMTAVDFFGQPNQKYLGKNSFKRGPSNDDQDEIDSWDDHDFDQIESGDKSDKNESSDDEEEHHVVVSKDKGDEESDYGSGNEINISSGRDPKTEAQIRSLEDEALAEKPWAMRGEVGGTQRPENSLLENMPEFEQAAKIAPTITIEHTETLEEMIRRRIIDEDWDDVVPRELPDIKGKVNGELPEVSQEKSKLGLGELYEREYLKKAAGYDVEAVEKQSEEEKAKTEIKALFATLCSKLDALSNYHFAPRPIAEDVEIRLSNAPAIALEEILPLHVSDARAFAPEDIYSAKRGRESVLKGESEMDQSARKRLRSAKKAARRKERKAKLADEKLVSRLQPGLGLNNPYERRKLREELSEARARGKLVEGRSDVKNTGFTKSTNFFKNLQETIDKGDTHNHKENNTGDKTSSSSFKL